MCNNTTNYNNYPVATAYLTIPTAMDVERCPSCRRSIETCRCEAPVQPRRRDIVDSVDAQSMGWDTCPTCRQNISDCCCAVKNKFAIDCAAKHITFMVDSAVSNGFLTLGRFDTHCRTCGMRCEECTCYVKNAKTMMDCAAKDIAFTVDSAVKNQFATTVKANTCLDCGRAVDKCRCDAPVKPHRPSTVHNGHLVSCR